jgi:membrane-associated phospholipid phosphatase
VNTLKKSPRRRIHCPLSLVLLAIAFASGAHAQTPGAELPNALPDAPQPANQAKADDRESVTVRKVPADILHEQAAIWTSPARIRDRNLPVLIPIVLATTVATTTDHQVMASARLNDPSLNSYASTASNGLLGGFVAAPVIIYGLGHIHHDDHATETGILAGEAMVDSLIVGEVVKVATLRERPNVDNAEGKFLQTSAGFNSSFPSEHSVVAWSSAAVIASEYPGILTQITAYGLATGVSLSRVLARQHFPSDVVVGSAVGWLIGRYVFRKHHHDD